MKTRIVVFVSCLLMAAIAGFGCRTEDDTLAPYVGTSRNMFGVVVQDSTFTPNVSWVGGYVTAFGVNRGSRAALDTSLVWLIHQSGNNIHFPVKFGALPSGAEDLTTQFNGTRLTQLGEDKLYTFWVMKEDAWVQASALPNRPLVFDSTITGAVVNVNDTVHVNALLSSVGSRVIDVWINVKDINLKGRLGTIDIIQSDTCNRPVVRFKVTQAGVTDTTLAAIGVVRGGQYLVQNVAWEVISEDLSSGTPEYWTQNVIKSPISMGDSVAGTRTFVEYPIEGLHRGQGYYIWIANKSWDRVSRIRSANGYAFATFNVW